MAVLGEVRELQVATVHPHELLQMIDIQAGQPFLDGRGGLRVPVVPPLGQTQQRFRKIEQLARSVLADHAGEFPAEQPHITAQQTVIQRGNCS